MNNNNNKIKGSTMTEYVLIVGLIAASSILALNSVGNNIATFFDGLSNIIANAGSNF